MSESSSWNKYLQRIGVEETEKEGLCFVNSIQWAIEDLIKDRTMLDKIDFEKIRNIRRTQLNRYSPLQRQLRDAWALNQGGTALFLNNEAEELVLTAALKEVEETTGIHLIWSKRFFGPNDIDSLREQASVPNTECILLIPGHAQPLFPQKSRSELANKLDRGQDYQFFGGNVIFISKT